ncbi:PEP-CTERM sorting domain-containing protein [Microcoleus sp. OTE_8_concoct_300]
MIIETADATEPVPEPTTIFGSAIGLCLGGWLKRKKSSQQDKTTPQS